MYIIEGNIGAGKSTFLRLIQSLLPHISVIFEPIHTWQNNSSGDSILAHFYNNPHRWAYTMETIALASRVQEHIKEQTNSYPFRIMERSIYSGRYVFAKNGFESGFLNTLEWQIYNEWFTFLTTTSCKLPQGFIYLRVDPEIAFERIKKRQRSAELSISLEYIHQIHTCHEDFLIHKKNMPSHLAQIPVLVIDCNPEFEKEPAEFEKHIEAIEKFMVSDLLQYDSVSVDQSRPPIKPVSKVE
ncbi:deoxynucleoside kinase [Candidatus Dependentiae bacterium]|nr:deoxynucleoside kinase [Candidatus Dependentiae bacterium]